MKTLTRYISWKFITSITAVFFLCLCLIYLIDLIEVMRITLKKGGALGDAMLISLLRVPAFAELALPFAVLIGSIGAFLVMSKDSELIVARSSGMSVWQFIWPAVIVGMMVGVFATTAYNPLATWSGAMSEDLQSNLSKKKKRILAYGRQAWLRQDSPDGQSILVAQQVSKQGQQLLGATFFVYDMEGRFKERVDARSARLKAGRWFLEDVDLAVEKEDIRHFKHFVISTYLTKTQVKDQLGRAETLSFWELPRYIKIAQKAGLPARQYRLQYQTLLSRPLWMVAMVMLAATCSLQSFRFGNVQKMITYGLIGGFLFFIFAQISRNMGLSGHTSAILAAWGPAAIACLVAASVLMVQEDG